MKHILIVDDDRQMRRTLQILIEAMGFDSVAAGNADEATSQLSQRHFDLVVTDLKMPGATGIDLLEDVRASHPHLPVILITAYGTIETAIEAMKKGASDFLLKPFDNESFERVIRRVLDLERFRTENQFLREQLAGSWAAEDLFLELPGLAEVGDMISKVAPTNSPVLIRGETGAGKEVAARCVHRLSKRADGLLVPINCAALPGELLEAELFGHARGAFTGAESARKGKFEIANGGTLFLDEIGDMPMSLQAKLLRVLEDSIVEPLGTNERIPVDVRIVSATNQDLQQAIDEKRFRSDLYYRLNNFEICLPPLRDRIEDIEILAHAFVGRFGGEVGKPRAALSTEAIEVLQEYAWPGNVRELRNLAERAVVLSNDTEIGADFFATMLGASSAPNPGPAHKPEPADTELRGPTLAETVARFERREILRTLEETGDNKAEAARRLGVSERNLWYKLKKHGL